MQIRTATPWDAATVALLGRITFAETFGQLFEAHPRDLRNYLDETFAVAKIEASLEKPENAYWLAYLDRLPVGYAKLKHPSPLPRHPSRTAVQLQKIYVLREFLGERIGQGLLHHVVQEAANRAPTLWLEVLKENDRAIGFYRKNGFASAGAEAFTIGAQTFQFHLLAREIA